MNKVKLLALILTAALTACGGTTDENLDTGTDAGTTGGNDAGQVVATGGLSISTPFGISLKDMPELGGYAVDGFIIVKRDGTTITTATVTLNGVNVPIEADWHVLGANVGTIPNATAGDTLKIVATDGTDTAEMNLPCPTEVTFTAPAEGTVVAAGESVTFSWSGKLGPYAWGVLSSPHLTLFGNEPGEAGDHIYSLGFPKKGVNYASLEAGDTSTVLVLPEISQPAYFARLYVPGDEVKSGDDDSGYCQIERTRHLPKAEAR